MRSLRRPVSPCVRRVMASASRPGSTKSSPWPTTSLSLLTLLRILVEDGDPRRLDPEGHIRADAVRLLDSRRDPQARSRPRNVGHLGVARALRPDRRARGGGPSGARRTGAPRTSTPPSTESGESRPSSTWCSTPPPPPKRSRRRQRVKVDSIEVGDTSAVDLCPENLPEEKFSRAFVLSNRWAFDTASELTLRSAPRRPPARVEKAANDYLDLSLLLSNFGAPPRDHRGVRRDPHTASVCSVAERIGEDSSSTTLLRSASRIHQSPSSKRVTPDALSQIGRRFIEMFAAAGNGERAAATRSSQAARSWATGKVSKSTRELNLDGPGATFIPQVVELPPSPSCPSSPEPHGGPPDLMWDGAEGVGRPAATGPPE